MLGFFWIYGLHLHILLFTYVTDEKVSKPGLLGETSVYEELRNSVFHTGRDLGVHDVEGQRILQVTDICSNVQLLSRNFVFTL